MKPAVALMCAVLVVAGCSSGDDDGGADGASPTTASSPSTTTSTTVPTATPDELAAAVCAAQPAPGGARLADPELTELSGVVALDSGWWAHNDSGDAARLFRLAEDGTTQAVLALDGIEATDWEDLSSAGPSSGELFVGDIGDNEGARPEVLVHRVTLPDPPPTGEQSADPSTVQTITLRYPDGARDAEALLVDPVSRDLVVVHKRFGGASEVYVAPEEDWSDGEAELVREGIVEVGDSPVDATTGGDVGYEGRVVALRTYAAVLVFPRHEGQSLGQALAENQPCNAPAAVETQGEALAFTGDGYVTIGEGARPAVNRWTVTVEGEG